MDLPVELQTLGYKYSDDLSGSDNLTSQHIRLSENGCIGAIGSTILFCLVLDNILPLKVTDLQLVKELP
jgi:hypothetical protein